MPSEFTKKAISVIKKIPEGKVATYGLIAALCGNPRAARQIVRVLHTYSKKEGLPWHRVVNRFGEIKIKGEGSDIQKSLLESEGVGFGEKGCIDLERFIWLP